VEKDRVAPLSFRLDAKFSQSRGQSLGTLPFGFRELRLLIRALSFGYREPTLFFGTLALRCRSCLR
jgi:hypothetical protein